jgi:hypothetical protein
LLAGAHRILRIFTNRQHAAEPYRKVGELPILPRRAWVQSWHRLLEAALHRSSAWWPCPRPFLDSLPLIPGDVVRKGRPPLAIAGALCEQRQPILSADPQQLQRDLTASSVSSLLSKFGGA